MTTTAATPFAARVDDALRQVQLVLSDGALDAEQVARLNAQVRRLREEVVEPEARRVAPPGYPVVVGLTETEGDAIADLFERAADERVDGLMLMPSPLQKCAFRSVARRVRAAGIDLLARRLGAVEAVPAATTPAADAALANGPEGAA